MRNSSATMESGRSVEWTIAVPMLKDGSNGLATIFLPTNSLTLNGSTMAMPMPSDTKTRDDAGQ